MLYSVYKDLVYGAYYIDALTLIQSQHLFDGILNNMAFEAEAEPENTKSYNHSMIDFESGTNDSRLEGKSIAIHAVRGTMLKHDTMCGPVGMRTIGQRITTADNQEGTIAHVVIFETGGGQSVAVPELTDPIKNTTKKTYGFVDGYALSAGQYGLSYCDEKWASRSTDMLGSIGTMTIFQGRKSGEPDQNGVKEFRVYATKSYEKNKEFEDAMNDGNIAFTVQHLDKLNDQFHEDIRTNYPLVEDKHLTGATFQAKEVDGILIDGIKPLNELLDHITQQYLADNPDTTNQKSHSMKQFTTVNSTIGVDTLESADDTVTLNEAQMESIDAALVAGTSAQSKIEAAEQAMNDAVAARQTADDALVAANARIADLENEPGGEPAHVHKKADGTGSKLSEDQQAIKNGQSLFESYKKEGSLL